MRNWLVGLIVLLCTPAFAQQQAPVIVFDSVPDPLKLPDNLYFGEVTGIAVNSNGHIFVLSRGDTTGPAYAAAAAQLLEFDADGYYLREIGHHLYAWSFAHMVKIDRHDNIWVTDKGSDMVIKFTPAGRVAMVFGRKQEASDEETNPSRVCAASSACDLAVQESWLPPNCGLKLSTHLRRQHTTGLK